MSLFFQDSANTGTLIEVILRCGISINAITYVAIVNTAASSNPRSDFEAKMNVSTVLESRFKNCAPKTKSPKLIILPFSRDVTGLMLLTNINAPVVRRTKNKANTGTKYRRENNVKK